MARLDWLARPAVAAFGLMLVAGCVSAKNEKDKYLPSTTAPPGSVSSTSAREGQAPPKRKPKAGKLDTIMALVAYDVQGTPVVVEVQHSSGDPDVDARAVQMVVQKMRFPKGNPNTIVIPINPKSVPKAPKPAKAQ